MRNSLLISIIFAAAASVADILPRTSSEQNNVNPPPTGVAAYEVHPETASAVLYVGQDGRALPVVDPNALRSYRSAPIPPERLDVDPGTSTVSKHANGTDLFASTGVQSIIKITVLDGSAIGNVLWEQTVGNMLMPGSVDANLTVDGSTAAITYTTTNNAGIYNVRVYPKTLPILNDTTAADILIQDTLGTFRLSDLRSQLLNRYNGNRGEDWSQYPAKTRVDLNNNIVGFGDSSGIWFATSLGRLDIHAGNVHALSVTGAYNNAPSAASITVTDFDAGAASGTVTLKASAAGIPPEQCLLYTASELSDPFLQDPAATRTVNPDGTLTFTTPQQPGERRFYQIRAAGTISATVEILGDFILRSPNGTRWKITVSDAGTLSATKAP